MNTTTKTLSALAGLALVAGSANAAVITPTIHAPLTTTTAVGGYEIGKTVDGSGLSDPNSTPGDVLDDVNDNGATQWLNDGVNIGAEVVTFDLGGTYDVDSVHLWNWVYNNGTSTKWGVKTVAISFSTNGTTFGSTETVSFIPNPALSGPSTAQTQTFSTKAGVTHIQLYNFTNFEGSNRVGFGEIRFSEAIPELSSLALLGLGGLALLRRHRRKKGSVWGQCANLDKMPHTPARYDPSKSRFKPYGFEPLGVRPEPLPLQAKPPRNWWGFSDPYGPERVPLTPRRMHGQSAMDLIRTERRTNYANLAESPQTRLKSGLAQLALL